MKRVIHILILSSVLSLGMGSCSSSIEEVCRDRLPELRRDFAKFETEVAAVAPQKSGRAIASVTHQNQIFKLPREQKDQWQDWSEEKLVQAEKFEDVIRTHSELRPVMAPLSELANEFVKFDGYVESGRVYQALASLQRAEVRAGEVEQKLCSVPK